MSVVLISDTNILIDFRNAGLLERLFQLPYEFHTTDFVMDELSLEDADAAVSLGLRVNGFEGSEIQELYAIATATRNSSIADASCFFLARKTGHPLLTGDMRLRRACEESGIVVKGALWLLDDLVRLAILTPSEAAEALQSMLDLGARFPTDACEDRLSKWT